MYHLIDRLHTLYGLLQDEQSKEIFLARFAVDIEPSVPNVKRLVSSGGYNDQGFLGWTQSQKDVLKKLNREHKKIVLYGTGMTGRFVAKIMQYEQIDFFAFCGRRAEIFPDGLFGKPVLCPDELVAHGDEYYVVPAAAKESYAEIVKFLHEHNYPKEHILDWVDYNSVGEEQYFEFPELYRRGTAFIDGGCYDCGESYKFAEWCEGAYSSIIAFEPDPVNYSKCCKKIQAVPLPNFQLFNAGLSDREGTAMLDMHNSVGSRIIPAGFDVLQSEINIGNKVSIHTVSVDDVVGDRTVGFIKMDIEGAEFDALHGAKNTIIRDKPLLAICVYHLQGDLFAIMDYLHKLLPEYRFWLRHYGLVMGDTVLYASIDL